uniref:Uncharacterized protein n=1 Tax=Caenorhabditis japonica TaxID=281687 RepID=A0A8R1DZ11_CAEJA
MEALQNRLEKLEHATGSDIWQILKESEEDLRQDMASLNTMREEKERKNRETIRILQEKRKELAEFKNSVKSLKTEYQNHIKAVEEGLKASGLNMKQVVRVYEQVLADSLSEKRSELVSILILDEPFMEQMQEILGKALKILENGRQKELRNLVAGEVAEFHGKVVEIWRKEMWNLFQKYNLPMNALEDTSKLPAFIEKLIEICQFSADLDLLLTGSHSESIPTLLSTGFGHLINLCVDMIENEKGEADFEWILTSAHKWSKNLKEMMERGVRGTSIEDLWKRTFDEVFNAKFVTFIHSITKVFVMKNLNDPLLFTKLSKLFRRFEATCEFDISDHDLFEPLYSPEVMSKWVLLEVELFTFTATKILSDPNCFQPLSAISIGSTATSSRSWASEVTVFFEEWLIRVDSDVSVLGDVEVQKAFLESVHALMLDVSNRIHHAANQLYAESTWSNDVYLVMNTMWELRRMVENLTVTWPISSFEIEKVYENEWRRLAGMISEYLNDIVDSLDKTVRSNYVGSAEKIQLIQEGRTSRFETLN